MGHLRSESVFHLAARRFYFSHTCSNIEQYTMKLCPCCKECKLKSGTTASLVSIATKQPLEPVSLEFLNIERSAGRFEYILASMYHFICYAQDYLTKNKEVKTVADKFNNDLILRFDYPMCINNDQGPQSENKFLKLLE